MLIIKAVVNNKNYAVYAENVEFQTERNGEDYSVEFLFEEVSILENGKEKTAFGETFSGYKLDAYDIATILSTAYVNENEAVQFTEPCEELIQFKNQFFENSGITVNGRVIPKWFCFPQEDCILHLDAVSVDGFCYYSLYDHIALVNNGEVITDYECFAMQSLTDEYKNNKLLYMSPTIKAYASEIFGE